MTETKEKIGQETLFANKLFINAVLPLLKPIVEARPKLAKGWAGKSAVCQVCCGTGDGEMDGIHYVIEDGLWTVVRGCYDGKPDVMLRFKSREHMNNFFKGKQLPLPKMKGVFSGHFMAFMKPLLAMASLLGAQEPPKDLEDQRLMVKCYFYLLTSGISTLNKLEHPAIRGWTAMSPDRVYALEVAGDEELSAFLRIKAGKSKASRGVYKRSMPFFTMRFDSPHSAILTLLDKDDMIEATISGRLQTIGGPEFGAQLGEHMKAVGAFIQ